MEGQIIPRATAHSTPYIKKHLHSPIPNSENDHCAKNPFFRSVARRCRFDSSHSTKQLNRIAGSIAENVQADPDVPEHTKGDRPNLKNKKGELLHIPQVPQADSSDSQNITITLEQLEDCKLRGIDSLHLDKSRISTPECAGPECPQSTFEEEVLEIKADMEYSKNMSVGICNYFDVIRTLPQLTDKDVADKKVFLPIKRLTSTGKTIFINLDGTLITALGRKPISPVWKEVSYFSLITNDWELKYVKMRPGVKTLLKELYPLYEIVVFTSAEKSYAREIIEKVIDPGQKLIGHLLTKEHCVKVGRYYIKDLRVIANREMQNMMILDHSIVSFSAQVNNGVRVSPFKGNNSDAALFPIINFLKQLALAPDVRKEIRRTFFLTDLYSVYLKEK